MSDQSESIERLKKLRDEGTLTDEDFQKMVMEVVNSDSSAGEEKSASSSKAKAGTRTKYYVLGAAAAVIVVLVILFATNVIHFKPNNMSDAAYNAGMTSVEITQSYLDGNISADTAYQQLDEQYDIISSHSSGESKDLTVQINIFSIRTALFEHRSSWSAAGMSTGSDDDVKEALDELKSTLGYVVL